MPITIAVADITTVNVFMAAWWSVLPYECVAGTSIPGQESTGSLEPGLTFQ